MPFAGVFRDNNLREDISLDKIASLKPAFDKSERGTLTAANSTPLTDGAASVLLASEEWAARRALPMRPISPIRRPRPTTLSPARAADGSHHRRLADARACPPKLQDFDFYEIHEAFAAQVLVTLKAFEDPAYCKTILGREAPLGAIDRAKLNVKGSSLAFGHPFAATGARIIAKLAKLLSEHGGRGPDLGVHRRRHGRGCHHGEPQAATMKAAA